MIIFILCSEALPQNKRLIDSLKNVITVSKNDTNKVKILYEIGNQYERSILDSALYYYNEALKVAEDIEEKKFIAQCLISIGFNLNTKGVNEKAIQYLERALKISEKLEDKEKISSCYLGLGAIHQDTGSYEMAIEFFLKALENAKEIEFKKGISRSYNLLGIVYYDQGSYDQSIESYLQALIQFEELGDKRNMSACFNNIALVHLEQRSYDKSIEYLQKSLALNEEIGHKRGMAICYTNIGNIFILQKDYDKGIEFHEKALELFEELGDDRGISTITHDLGKTYFIKGSYKKAHEYYLEAVNIYKELDYKMGIAQAEVDLAELSISLADSVAVNENQRLKYLSQAVSYGNESIVKAREMNIWPTIKSAANSLMSAHEKLGNHEKAMECARIFIIAQDSMFNEEKTRAIIEMETKYATEKKQQQIELQESQIIARDATIKQQRTFRNALGTGFLAVLVVILVVAYAYIQKRKDNKKISEQNEKIKEVNEELTVLNESISRQNNEIVDSITYAQRIQAAMLPPESYINELLTENFILFKPRDIVSGDFYWIKQLNQYIILAAADCTGHGVPGALMSMLGISYLNEIVRRGEITQANQVLNELRNQIKRSLRQHGQPDESKDGVDMAVCVIDEKKRVMQYSGAYNPLYLIRDEQGTPVLKEVKADRMPVGYYQGREKPFTNHNIQLEPGDTFYLFSDGYIDQKGGKDKRKFMSKNFKNLLIEIQDLTMYEQKNILLQTLEEWMGDYPQRDDILIIGVRY